MVNEKKMRLRRLFLLVLVERFFTGLAVKIAVIGGGASGMFSCISAAQKLQESKTDVAKVLVYESGTKLMTKVAISGGGRCNVLHDTSKRKNDILSCYPRGSKELNGLFSRFSPSDARLWFEERGVELKTEQDGRMFPVSDSSQTIINTLLKAANENNVEINTRINVIEVMKDDDDDIFILKFVEGNAIKTIRVQCIILATGSSPVGHKIAHSLGHEIINPVPSLFTLRTNMVQSGGAFHGLAGLSMDAKLTFQIKAKKKNKIIAQQGPVLITHHGLSGPATLRLSAFAAREFNSMNYKCEIQCNFAPNAGSVQEIFDILWKQTKLTPKRLVSSVCPFSLPRRLWKALVVFSDIVEKQTTWANVSKKLIKTLSKNIADLNIPVNGKVSFKEEFVTAGGVHLKEIDMKRMESKICPGLFFCGEAIDIDGVTGGFNFMNCWSTGYVAGTSAAKYAIHKYS